MTQVVYVDVLLALNLFVNYFLLLACGKILRCEIKRRRLLLGAGIGAVYSLIIFFPNLNAVLSVALKLLVCSVMSISSFGFGSFRSFLRACGCLFGVSFVFGGVMLAIYLAFEPKGMVYCNGAVYFNISLMFITVATTVCYIITSLLSKLLRRNAPENHIYKITLTLREKSVTAFALMDTGNSLTDSFTDTPVMLIEWKLAKEILPEEWQEFFKENKNEILLPPKDSGFRLIPYKSVGINGVLPAFKPDKLEVRTVSKSFTVTRVYAAVIHTGLSGGEYSALLNPRLISRENREGISHENNFKNKIHNK